MAFSLLYSLTRNLVPSKVHEKVDSAIFFVGQFLSCSRPSLDEDNNLSVVISGNETDDKKLNAVISTPLRKSSNAKKAVDGKKLSDLKLSQARSWSDKEILPTSRRSSEKTNSGNTNKVQKNTPESKVEERYDFAALKAALIKLLEFKGENISLAVIFEQQGLHVINEIVFPSEKVNDFLEVNPMLRKLVLDAEGNYNEVLYTSRAVVTLFQFAFGDSYYLRNTDVAVETYALSKAYQISSLKKYCCGFLEQKRNFNSYQIEKNFKYMEYYRLYEIRNLLIPRSWGKSFKYANPFESYVESPECYVAWNYHHVITDIRFPLYPIEKTINDSFEADITNKVVISHVSSECAIWGAQIKLNTDLKGKDVPLKIVYQVRMGECTFEEEVEESLRPSIPITFKKIIIADEGESIEVTFIVEDIRASLCSRSLDTRYILKTNNENISVTLSSSRKSASNDPLIFIEKIFYNFISDVE